LTKSEIDKQYKLKFHPDALDEWNKLDGSVKVLLRKALKKGSTTLISPDQHCTEICRTAIKSSYANRDTG
jgi:mRNA-degrading endonuclease RelE of RelBE toxin-antitoxin system